MNRWPTLLGILALRLGGCGGSGAPAVALEVRSSAVVDALPAVVPPRPSASVAWARAEPEPRVVIGRITDRESGRGSCDKDDECVIVTRLEREELCPPGIAVSRAFAELEESWQRRGLGYQPTRDPCPELDRVARAGCASGKCATFRGPGSESATLDERIVGARLPEIESCFAEGTRDAPPPVNQVTATLAVARSGDVAAVRLDPAEAWPPFESCTRRVLIRLAFPRTRDVRVLSVPFTFR